jgi:hypothetical protein
MGARTDGNCPRRRGITITRVVVTCPHRNPARCGARELADNF